MLIYKIKKMNRYLILLFTFAIAPIVTNAQAPVSVQMHYGGNFQFDGDTDYVILDFENKSDMDIYDDMMMNVFFLYKQPNDVVSGVNGKMIKVRGGTNISFVDEDGEKRKGSVYYRICFWIKNGKVKVKAPVLEDVTYLSSNYPVIRREIKPSELASIYGESSDQSGLTELEDYLSYEINYILGLVSGTYPYHQNW